MTSGEQCGFSSEQVAAAEAQIVQQSRKIEFYLTEYTIELLALKMSNGDFEVPSAASNLGIRVGKIVGIGEIG